MEIVLQFDFNLTIIVHSSRWRSKMNWNIGIPIRISHPGILGEKIVRPESIIVTMHA